MTSAPGALQRSRSAATTRSMRMNREPLTSTASAGCAASASMSSCSKASAWRPGRPAARAASAAARAAAEAATAAGLPARHAEAFEQLDLAALAAEPADAVLVKGSRFMRMERVVAALRERWSAEARDTGGASREGVEHAA